MASGNKSESHGNRIYLYARRAFPAEIPTHFGFPATHHSLIEASERRESRAKLIDTATARYYSRLGESASKRHTQNTAKRNFPMTIYNIPARVYMCIYTLLPRLIHLSRLVE